MIPLVDIHCHLLAGLDDGPRTQEESLSMCQDAFRDGIRMAAATVHQSQRYPAVTPDRVREAARQLVRELRGRGIPLLVFPCAEIRAHPDLASSWRTGTLLSVADRGQYLLLELPPGDPFIDLRPALARLRQAGVRPILAHAERHPELLHEPDRTDQLLRAGCLIQVSSGSITDPPSREDAQALKSWFQRGMAHLVGSDGHSLSGRPPHMAAAYREIVRWAGSAVADRVCSTNGLAILNGLPLRIARPRPQRRPWFALFW